MKIVAKSVLLLGLLTVSTVAPAQAFPSKPVHIVIGFSAGGVIDGFTRQLAPRLASALGQPVIVENKPGANGILAMEYVSKAPPDGHTILMGAAGNVSLNELFYTSLPYQLERDFAPVTQVTSASLLLLTNASVPVRSVGELVSYIKADPSRVNYASTGNGSSPNLAAEMFNMSAGVKAMHVPYKGSGQAMTDLIGGQVQFMLDAAAIGMPHVRSGKLRAIASTGRQRMAILPDVPTVAETLPGFEVVNWFGMLVPRATPKEAVRRLRDEVYKAVNTPDMRDKMLSEGMEPVGSTPDEFAAFIKQEKAKWGDIIKKSGIRIE